MSGAHDCCASYREMYWRPWEEDPLGPLSGYSSYFSPFMIPIVHGFQRHLVVITEHVGCHSGSNNVRKRQEKKKEMSRVKDPGAQPRSSVVSHARKATQFGIVYMIRFHGEISVHVIERSVEGVWSGGRQPAWSW